MSINLLLLYLATWSIVALTPGPAVLCAMSLAARHGFRRTLFGIIGIQGGHLIFFGCVACGLAALLASASAAFTILRLLGAGYLIYLGSRIIASTRGTNVIAEATGPLPNRGNLLLQGFLIQITNPKALLFMSALLPQFLEPRHSLGSQLAILLAATIMVDTLVLSAYACFALRGARYFQTSRVTLWLERAFGGVLVLFGFRLLTIRR